MIKPEHEELHEHLGSAKTCKACSSEYCHECYPSVFGICERCGYKILALLVCIMVIVSYVVWFGLF